MVTKMMADSLFRETIRSETKQQLHGKPYFPDQKTRVRAGLLGDTTASAGPSNFIVGKPTS
jgi:hypothetical protein